jgi:hypothetical protein
MRGIAVTALVLNLSVVGAGELQAQRSGFIIGFGIGAGVSAISGGDTRAAAQEFSLSQVSQP